MNTEQQLKKDIADKQRELAKMKKAKTVAKKKAQALPTKMLKKYKALSREARVKKLANVIASFYGMGSPEKKRAAGHTVDVSKAKYQLNKHLILFGLTKADVPEAKELANRIIGKRTQSFVGGKDKALSDTGIENSEMK